MAIVVVMLLSPKDQVAGPLPNGYENGLLVGGFNPFEKYARQNGFIFPNFRGEHKKYLKPPSSL